MHHSQMLQIVTECRCDRGLISSRLTRNRSGDQASPLHVLPSQTLPFHVVMRGTAYCACKNWSAYYRQSNHLRETKELQLDVHP